MQTTTPSLTAMGPLVGRRKFVSVRERHANGLIEFLFAIDDADLCVELVMPQAAFDEFCADNHVEFVDSLMPSAPEGAADFAWDLHQATRVRFR